MPVQDLLPSQALLSSLENGPWFLFSQLWLSLFAYPRVED
jgi:hypothetical protein